MRITRKNYESYFLDYHDGNLDKVAVNELMDFLAANPDLKEELESFKNVVLNIDHGARFGEKEKLKKNTITAYNYKTWLVAFTENDLNISQKVEVKDFLDKNPVYKGELELLNQARLIPETDVRFHNKSLLKKGGVVVPIWLRMAAAAAIVIAILGYWFARNETVKEVADMRLPKVDKHETKAPNSQIKINSSSPIQKSSNTTLALRTAKRNTPSQKNQSAAPLLSQSAEYPAKQSREEPAENVIAEEAPSIVIHSTGKGTGEGINEDTDPFVALDDDDLVELGLKKKEVVPNSTVLQSAMKSAGNLLGINVKHSVEDNMISSTRKETFALGKVEISRTVLR